LCEELNILGKVEDAKYSALHFEKFITARGAKSIIASNCVFNPTYGLPGIFKIKILYLDSILDTI
jgi:hypothetical protein